MRGVRALQVKAPVALPLYTAGGWTLALFEYLLLRASLHLLDWLVVRGRHHRRAAEVLMRVHKAEGAAEQGEASVPKPKTPKPLKPLKSFKGETGETDTHATAHRSGRLSLLRHTL